MSNLSKLFQTNVRIVNINCMDPEAIWPHNVEIAIARVPIRKRDNYLVEDMQEFAHHLKNSMVHNGIVFLICYAPVEDRARPFEVARTMTDAGFTHIDNIIVQKTWFPGKRSEVNLVNSHEYVFHFCNGKVWKLDRLPIREYLETGEDISCPGNTWKVNTGSLDENIAPDLAELLLRMTDALPGSIVFDPMMGNQSTLSAALKLGHSFYGFEKDNARIKRYKKIIDKFNKTGSV